MGTLQHMRQAALQYSLSRAAIFAGLPEEDLRHLATYAAIRRLERGAYLFRQGDPVVGFFVVRLGLLNVHRIDAEGREQIIHLLRPGESFAERAITSEHGYPANARAEQDSEVILIPGAEFRQHQQERPDLAWRMLSSMSHHLRSLVATIEGLRFNDVETRLIYWLLQRCPSTQASDPVDIDLGTSKGHLADELTTRPETLSRNFRKLSNAGLIEVTTRAITVRDPAALQGLFDQKTAARKKTARS